MGSALIALFGLLVEFASMSESSAPVAPPVGNGVSAVLLGGGLGGLLKKKNDALFLFQPVLEERGSGF